MWRRPLGSLPTRLGFFVLGVTLCTALVITAISLESIDGFLREKTEESFPALLDRTAIDLEAWYAARLDEAAGFRRDPVIASYWADLILDPRFADNARDAISEQLDRRLEMSDAFEAAFILDTEGKQMLWRGQRAQLSLEMLEQTRSRPLTHAERWEGHGVQLARVRFGDESLPTLHLLFDLENLTEILSTHGRLLEGRVSIVDHSSLPSAGPARVSLTPRRWRRPARSPPGTSNRRRGSARGAARGAALSAIIRRKVSPVLRFVGGMAKCQVAVAGTGG